MIERFSTHLLDTVAGKPAAGVPVELFLIGADGESENVGQGVTDADGRIGSLAPVGQFPAGHYRFVFHTKDYFEKSTVFYPQIAIDVLLDGARSHYHIPVLASTFSYSTYLGS